MTYVLDTNIITAILKGNEKVKKKAQEVIVRGGNVFINGISYYEIKRGLLSADLTEKLKMFNVLCKKFGLVLLDTISFYDEAADIYAELYKERKLIEDADILIASTVKALDFILVSDNVRHFGRIEGLRIENWLY